MSHFLFLWLKMGLFDDDLFRQIVTLAHHLPMEIESLVLMLFSFTRIEKLLGVQQFRERIESDKHFAEVMRFLIRERLYKQRGKIEAYVMQDRAEDGNEQCVKLTMLLKALTFSHKYLADNFEPYILETIKETLRIAGKLIQSFDLSDEKVPLSIVTVINLL